MSKIRVYELAKSLEKESKDIIKILQSKGVEVKNHMSAIGDDEIKLVKEAFGLGEQQEKKEPVETKKEEKTNHKVEKQEKKVENTKKPEEKQETKKTSKKEAKKEEKQEAKKESKKQEVVKQEEEEETIKTITLPETITIKDLADKLKLAPAQLIKNLFMQGKMVNQNQEISFDEAAEIALEYNCIAEEEEK